MDADVDRGQKARIPQSGTRMTRMARILGKKLKTEINTGDPAERDHRGTEARRKYFTEVNEGNEAVNRRWTQMGADELFNHKEHKEKARF
jgi:hypothetical protein